MPAKFYIYRNLHKPNAFSVRHRGIVVDRLVDFIAHDVTFKVNEAGRLKVIASRHKEVHAFVVTERYEPSKMTASGLLRVSYNPYKTNTFMVDEMPIFQAKSVLFTGGRCYLVEL